MSRKPRISSNQHNKLMGMEVLSGLSIIGPTIAIPLSSIRDPKRKNHSEMSPHKYDAMKRDIAEHCIEPHLDFDPAVRPLSKDKYETIDGRHRLKAVRELKWKSVVCKTYNLSEKGARKLSIRRNNQHGDFTDALQDEIAALLKGGDSVEDLVCDLAFTEKELLDLAALSSVSDDLDKSLNSKTISIDSQSSLLEMKFLLSKEERNTVNKAIDKLMDEKRAAHPGAALAKICRSYLKG